MTHDSQKYNRRSIRLRDYDYTSPGAYFITICTQDRKSIFGEIVNNEMQLNELGESLQLIWNALPERFSNLELDHFVIMPDHIHGIIIIKETNFIFAEDSYKSELPERFRNSTYSKRATNRVSASFAPPHPRGAINRAPTELPSLRPADKNRILPLGEVIRTFKAVTAHKIHSQGRLDFKWQRNYHEHIIRKDDDLDRVRQYIIDNPAQWAENSLNREEMLPWLLD
jgi:REP element-mobilizing transposase RayT